MSADDIQTLRDSIGGPDYADVVEGGNAVLDRLLAWTAALRFSEREWRDKAQDKITEVESLVAYLSETADAIENHNVKRKQVAALLRKTMARYR